MVLPDRQGRMVRLKALKKSKAVKAVKIAGFDNYSQSSSLSYKFRHSRNRARQIKALSAPVPCIQQLPKFFRTK